MSNYVLVRWTAKFGTQFIKDFAPKYYHPEHRIRAEVFFITDDISEALLFKKNRDGDIVLREYTNDVRKYGSMQLDPRDIEGKKDEYAFYYQEINISLIEDKEIEKG